MTAASPRPRRVGRAAQIAAIAALGLTMLTWALLIPPLSGVDQPVHINSVVRLMQGGGWPPPQTAPVTEGVYVARQEAGIPLPGTSALDELPAPEDRTVIVPLDGDSHEGASDIDWMSQHPPTYYAIVAGVLTALGGADWRWDQLLLGMQAVTTLMGVGGLTFVAAAIRRVVGSGPAAAVGLLSLLAIPQLFNTLGRVTNDGLAFLAAGGAIFFVVRALTPRNPTWSRWPVDAVGAGALLGLGLLAKGTMLAAIPMVALAMLLAARRRPRGLVSRLAPAAVAMVVAFAVGGWYYVRNLLLFGQLQSTNSSQVMAPEPFDGFRLADFVALASRQLLRSFWGSFRPNLALPEWYLGLAFVLLALALLVTLQWRRSRPVLVMLLALPACVLALITWQSFRVFFSTGNMVGLQGRYFFPAITIYALCFAVAWARLVGRSRFPVVRAAGLAVLGLAPVLAGVWTTSRFVRVEWSAALTAGTLWQTVAQAGPTGPTTVQVVVVAALAASIGAVLLAIIDTVRSGPETDPGGRGRRRRTVAASRGGRTRPDISVDAVALGVRTPTDVRDGPLTYDR